MSTYTPSTQAGGGTVRLVRLHPKKPSKGPASRRAKKVNSKRVNALIARAIMLATTGFAFFDLFLLATGGHH